MLQKIPQPLQTFPLFCTHLVTGVGQKSHLYFCSEALPTIFAIDQILTSISLSINKHMWLNTFQNLQESWILSFIENYNNKIRIFMSGSTAYSSADILPKQNILPRILKISLHFLLWKWRIPSLRKIKSIEMKVRVITFISDPYIALEKVN